MVIGLLIAGAVLGYLAVGCVTSRILNEADRDFPPFEAGCVVLIWPLVAATVLFMRAWLALGKLGGGRT